jgi:enoyl-CoA hydratase/carnithine racemase
VSQLETILFEKSPDRVGTVTINRPDQLNSFNGTMCAEFQAIWSQIAAATIADKPAVATQGTVRAVWESLDMTRTAGLDTALKYCLLGNETGRKEVSREELMKKTKNYRIR